MRGVVAVGIGAASLLGCGAPAQDSHQTALPQASASARPAAPPPGFAEARWGEFISRRFGARIPLPDGHAWKIDDHGGPWLSAAHPPSGSALLLRTWREDDVVNRQRCEERARLWRKLPERSGAEIVETRPVNVPPDYDTVVEVGVSPSPGPKGAGSIDAFAMAFGARVRRCFAFVFTTSASGAGAEAAVGERLGAMVQGSLEKIEVESDLESRVGRERVPGGR